MAAQVLVSAHAKQARVPDWHQPCIFGSEPRRMELNSCAREIRCFLLPRRSPRALSDVPAQAETVVRYGISMADIPLTTGQPDRGAGAYQFIGLHDLRPAGGVGDGRRRPPRQAGPGPRHRVEGRRRRQEEMALHAAQGREIPRRQRVQRRCGDLESRQGAERQGAAIRQAPERAGEDPAAFGGELCQDRRRHGRDHHQDGRFLLPLPDALVPGLEPGAVRKARQGLGQVRQPALRHRARSS